MAGEDREYVYDVKQLPCARAGPDCNGGIEAHHAGPRGLGQRAHDHSCIPLCSYHHRCYHDCAGPFRGMLRDERRAWVDEEIAWTQEQVRGSHWVPQS